MPLIARLILSLASAVAISGIYLSFAQNQVPGFIFDTTAAIAFALTAAIAVALTFTPDNANTTNTKPSKPSKSRSSKSASGNEAGSVKWFNGNKGFGFITCDSGEEIFVHFRSVQKDSRRLSPGKRVEFTIIEGKKGREAENVRVV